MSSLTPNVTEVVLDMIVDDQIVKNILHFRDPSAIQEVGIPAFADEFMAWVETDFSLNAGNTMVFVGAMFTYLGSVQGTQFYRTFTNLQGGYISGGCGPNSVALCVKLGTATRGKSGHGRIYVAGCPNNYIAGSYIDHDYVDAVRLSLDNLRDPAVIFTFKHCVVSRYAQSVERNPYVSFDVTYTAADNVVDSQRRRLPGRGR